MVKNPPARDLVSISGWEDLQEKGMATHSTILAWRIPWTEETGKLEFLLVPFLNTMGNATISREAL